MVCKLFIMTCQISMNLLDNIYPVFLQYLCKDFGVQVRTDGSPEPNLLNRFFKVQSKVQQSADLEKHIDGMGTPPNPLIFTWTGPTPPTSDQITEYEEYEVKQLKWLMGEAVIK